MLSEYISKLKHGYTQIIKSESGMSLTEVLIASGMAVVIGLGIGCWISDMFVINKREDVKILMQHELVMPLPRLEKDIRNAGYNTTPDKAIDMDNSTEYKLVIKTDNNNDGTLETTIWEIASKNTGTPNQSDYFLTRNGSNIRGSFAKSAPVFKYNYSAADPNIVESIDISLKVLSPTDDPKINNQYYEQTLESKVFIRNSANE